MTNFLIIFLIRMNLPEIQNFLVEYQFNYAIGIVLFGNNIITHRFKSIKWILGSIFNRRLSGVIVAFSCSPTRLEHIPFFENIITFIVEHIYCVNGSYDLLIPCCSVRSCWSYQKIKKGFINFVFNDIRFVTYAN